MTVALIVAAGKGTRMGGPEGKQFLSLCGRPLLSYTMQAFDESSVIDKMVVVVNSAEIKPCRQMIEDHNIGKVDQLVVGGKERQDSVYNGLQKIKMSKGKIVIHDGARPLATLSLIEKAVKACRPDLGVVVGVPVSDTVKVASDGEITRTLNREQLWAIQTPQVFPLEVLLRAHQQAKRDSFYGTDDAALVERLGFRVRIVEGSYENIKVTTPLDLRLAEAILAERKK